MSLFGKKGKKDEAPKCACNGDAMEMEAETMGCGCCCGGNTICSIKVLGSGCKSCHQLLENSKDAIKSMDIDVEVEYVTDMSKIAEYGVMSTPALVVNEKVIAMGKVLKPDDIVKLLRKLGF